MKDILIAALADILEQPVDETTVLRDCEAWDSLTVVFTIAMLDEKAGVNVDGEQLMKCETVGDIIKLAGAA